MSWIKKVLCECKQNLRLVNKDEMKCLFDKDAIHVELVVKCLDCGRYNEFGYRYYTEKE